jgi:transposase InsO family protein
MPWKEASTMSLRDEFVTLATVPGVNMTTLCARFGISRKTGYKWLSRRAEEGTASLLDRSRRPHHSPAQTPAAMEQLVLALRRQHPAWGGRKLQRRLQDLGHADVPSPSTITAILRRHGLLTENRAGYPRSYTRFEHPAPNDLWQMDFKGHFALMNRQRCHPLTVLDDHSRFALGLRACENEQGLTVQQELTLIFRRYGLPHRMLMDHGPPWGGSSAEHKHTPLTVWLIRLGIAVSHGRPYHPQTQGKDERFHRTLDMELLCRTTLRDLPHTQQHFDAWRDDYNLHRPHEALDMDVPARRYQPSIRPFPKRLPELQYAADVTVRKVQAGGRLRFLGHEARVGYPFVGEFLGLRATDTDGLWNVYYGPLLLGRLDFRQPPHNTRYLLDRIQSDL